MNRHRILALMHKAEHPDDARTLSELAAYYETAVQVWAIRSLLVSVVADQKALDEAKAARITSELMSRLTTKGVT